MEEFEQFLLKLFAQLAVGNDLVGVECANDKTFDAKVIGYSKEYMTINVEFVSDNLTKPESVEVKGHGFGGMDYDDDNPTYKTVQVPVKRDHIWWKSIKLHDNF